MLHLPSLPPLLLLPPPSPAKGCDGRTCISVYIEDEELRFQLEELRLANQEVAGDDDTSDQEGITIEESGEAATA